MADVVRPAEWPMPSHDVQDPVAHIGFCVVYNISGEPAACVNGGFTEQGAPWGCRSQPAATPTAPHRPDYCENLHHSPFPKGHPPMRTPHRHGLAAALAVAALGLTACSAGSEDGADDAGPAQDASVSIGLAAVPANLDYTTSGGAAIFEALLGNVYEGLVQLDEHGEVEPLLAESWEISEDGTEYSFTLREDVTFHDGTPFDAEIVQFSLERLDEWTANTPDNLAAIDQVEVDSPTEVTMVLSEPDYDALYWLAGPLGTMFAPDSVDDLASEANGTGPFTFESYENAVQMDLARHEDYWGEPAGVAEASLVYYEDAAAAANALRTGGVDAILRAEAYDQVESFEEEDEFDVVIGDTQAVAVLAMSNDHEELSDPEVREAISLAIDKEAVLAAATTGHGTILGGPSVPTDSYYQDYSEERPHDPEAAEELLEQAGVEDLSLRFTLPNRPYAEAIAQVVQDDLGEIGISVDLETQEFPAVWVEQTMTNQDYDLTVVSHVEPRNMINYDDPDYYWGYDSEEAAEHFAEARAATDDADYASAMEAAADQVVQDAPGVWLYNSPNIVISRDGVEGLPEDDLGVGMNLSGISVDH